MGFYRSLIILIFILAANSAVAATYTLVKDKGTWLIPPECFTTNNGNVTCPNGLNLTSADSIITDGKTVFDVTGDANLNGVSIQVGATGIPLTINATGNINTGYQYNGEANLVASGAIVTGYQNTIVGNLSAAQITTGGQNNITGNLNAAQITTSYEDTITGSIIATQSIDINGRNTITGFISAPTSILLRSDNSVFNGNISSSGQITIGSSHTITGNLSGSDIITESPVTINGDISASGTFTLASGSQVTGDVEANNVNVLASNSNIQGDVTVIQNLVIGNSSGITGNASAETILLEASNAYITGSASATIEIQIDWQGTIGGNATAPTIENNGGTIAGEKFCDTGTGSTPPSCNTGTPPPPPPVDTCSLFNELADFGVVGGNGFTSGSGTQINDNDIVDETGLGGNTPTPSGTIDTVDLAFPPLDPAVFPSFISTGFYENQTNLAPGTYGTIHTKGANALSSTTGGGTYYIESITFTDNANTLNLGPGDYFIKSMFIGNNSTINIVPDGPVRLFIRDGISGGNDISFNSTGNVANLVVYLYEDADFIIGNYCNSGTNCPEFTFNGLIYSPSETANIEFGNNTNFQGGALTAGTVTLGNNSAITYSPQTQADVNEAAGCTPEPALVHHYRIQHPTQLVSCLAAPIEIIACANADCSETYDDTVTLTATASAANSTWSGDTIISTTTNSADWQFTLGTGSGYLRNINGGTTVISLNDAIPTATNITQCYNDAGTTITGCAVNFVSAGLVFTDTDGVSPIASSHAGLDFPILLQAIETNTTTGACEARVQGAQAVNVGLECANPLTCQADQTFTVNGTNVALNDNGTALTQTSVNVTFDANGSAPVTANYSDVGQVRLHASLELSENVGNGDPAIVLTGTSINDFVVRPHTLVARALDSSNNLWTATTDTGAGYKAAGEDFTFIVQALNAAGNPTPNFGNEVSATENVTVTFDSMAYPVIAGDTWSSSKLTITSPFIDDPDFAGAMRTVGARWREAGTPNILPGLLDNDYLGAGDALVRVPSPIGRFYPANFLVTSSNITNACPTDNFTYMGQPGIHVAFEIVAVNTLGVVTQNYHSPEYSNAAQLELTAANTSPADVASDEFASRLVAPLTSNWVNGRFDQLGMSATFNRLASEVPDGPYSAVRLGLRVLSEMDNRNFATTDLLTQKGPSAQLNGTLALRYGRLVLENTYGPENESLPVVMRAEYWDGTRFTLNDLDSCTASSPTSLAIVDNPSALNTSVAGVGSNLITGEVIPESLYWTAPSPVGSGEFLFEYQADSWLEYPWLDENGDSHRFPRATAGFGQYRGNDRVIFWMERQ
ncbi:polymer-forming cytoskeletal protein [Pseudidiomarina andamanensis]|uniref:Polymer-forming cytoskeletal protein n=1 Tax=Pseudidiomarina andamanensis TaxID=1940690 RepID=A0AA92IN53_9GAMM|nr:polymer-forming cytoskeletal protein [Pseudidiomarina andamanensis]MDS0217544.1 polymer-forming cytoskeletal protein [Pseudidiomarina andamanensis]QGT96542.1 polymer-forming cytoskeletal protein [Pseudidiomarina andamanensis]